LLTISRFMVKGAPTTVRVSTDLSIPAELACRLAQKPAVFRHVVWPIFGVRHMPESLRPGEELSARIYWLLVLPGWIHTLRLVSVTPTEIYSNERGGMVRKWNHRLTFDPTSESSCRYTDEVDIEAGVFTSLVAAFARVTYRWRQRRWRQIAELLA